MAIEGRRRQGEEMKLEYKDKNGKKEDERGKEDRRGQGAVLSFGGGLT